ncbi:DEAD/DEAH box helicase [Thermogemmatispora onikobensis]|uniref:DEAD/DEAH box helicase n=1 Tax=Thermogemmatispora onikobensis TaxID=732234 RepID=UPI000852C58E|nr:DEAD/DEAH box helicase [Thermogemmatispora onikobensis]
MNQTTSQQHYDLSTIARELQQQLIRYIEAQYPIRHSDVVEERRRLLEEPKVIAREPYIESTPGYPGGRSYTNLDLPPVIGQALAELAGQATGLPPLIPPQPYPHQGEALEALLGQDRDLILTTGTGSGKTEVFLLTILARSLDEAGQRRESFALPGMRTLILYPTNALVNDQLVRLRRLFGNHAFARWFKERYGVSRPLRFGMYTSRTPYPGQMSQERNKAQLLPLLDFYANVSPEQRQEQEERGRWPACNLERLHDAAIRGAVEIDADDRELYSRHQIQRCCPDILITNYSMLEYMLMRPIERSIFAQTAQWLESHPANSLLIVLDEAHLYSGATGAEISLLLRRLQARLGIGRERVRYILTSASLDPSAGETGILTFAEGLVGARGSAGASFAIVRGEPSQPPSAPSVVNGRPLPRPTPETEGAALAAFDLTAFANRVLDEGAALRAVEDLSQRLGWPAPSSLAELPLYLGRCLSSLQSFRLLWSQTAGKARALSELAARLFPSLSEQERVRATSALLSLAAAACREDDQPLLPVRAHFLFRGLPTLYACVNPRCSALLHQTDGPSTLGRLWLSPRLHCDCGARVYELYAHRNCGALFLRVFTTTGSAGPQTQFLWHEPGEDRNQAHEELLLIGSPHPRQHSTQSHLQELRLHIQTGNAYVVGKGLQSTWAWGREEEFITLYRPAPENKSKTSSNASNGGDQPAAGNGWKSCPVCLKRLTTSDALASLATRGEQPFVNLVRRQFELQPPRTPAREAAPNMGRKVLLFSDGRQRAARLARDLPREVELDTFREALILAADRLRQRHGQELVPLDGKLQREFIIVCSKYDLYFFDGDSQKELLRRIHEFRQDYQENEDLAIAEDWTPALIPGYRRALLRQVADRFYSLPRMCIAIIEPAPAAFRALHRKFSASGLSDEELRALAIQWIAELLELSAFDDGIAFSDRQMTVPGEGFREDKSPLEAEKMARELLKVGNEKEFRQAMIDVLCSSSSNGPRFLRPEQLALRLTLDDKWYQCRDCTQLVWQPLRGRCPARSCRSENLQPLPTEDISLQARTAFYREPLRQVLAGQRRPMHLTAEEHTAQLSHRDSQAVSSTTEEYELRFQEIGISAEKPAIDVLSCTTTMEVGVDIGQLLGVGLRNIPPTRASYQQRAGRAGRRGAALSTVLAYSENGSHDGHYFDHPEEMISDPVPCPRLSPVNKRLLTRHIQAALLQTFFREYVEGKTEAALQRSSLPEALGRASDFFQEKGAATLSRFGTWLKQMLRERPLEFRRHVIAWLPDEIEGQRCDLERKFAIVGEIGARLCERLEELQREFEEQRLLLSAGWMSASSADDVKEVLLLDLFFDQGLLPQYAFPRELRSFVIEKKNHQRFGFRERPQQSVDIALTEYAPGRELVVNKETYQSGGIYVTLFPGLAPSNAPSPVERFFKQARRRFLLCQVCGYLEETTTRKGENGSTGVLEQPCPQCHTPLREQEILDPPAFAPWGATSRERRSSAHSAQQEQGIIYTAAHQVMPLTSRDRLDRETSNGGTAWAYKENQELLIVNAGPGGTGFTICRSCGAAVVGASSAALEGSSYHAHPRPFLSAQEQYCKSRSYWYGYLGHIFRSDLLLLRLTLPWGTRYEVGQSWLADAAHTLAQALQLAATRLLDIQSGELRIGWNYTPMGNGVLVGRSIDFFLFDALAGGAGYATQVGQEIEQLLDKTLEILKECPEHCEQSCYRCLRNYGNRMLHYRLDRHLGRRLLQAIVEQRAPAAFSLEEQRRQLEGLAQFLTLQGYDCHQPDWLAGQLVPLLAKDEDGNLLAVGTYPVEQDYKQTGHPLQELGPRVCLVSDYELRHDLPGVAQEVHSAMSGSR